MIPGPEGPQGEQGPKGEDGEGIRIAGWTTDGGQSGHELYGAKWGHIH